MRRKRLCKNEKEIKNNFSRKYLFLNVRNDILFRLSLVRVLGFLAKSKMERAKAILKEAGVPFFLDALNTKECKTLKIL